VEDTRRDILAAGCKFGNPTVVKLKSKIATDPHETPSGFVLMFASLATALAGFLDAVGYNQLDHLYVSFMSGNSTHFGMALAAAGWGEAVKAGYLICTFVLGTFLGTVILDAVERPLRSILWGEALLCVVALGLASLGVIECALTLTAAMMGMQNVLHQNVHDTDAGKGFITGALFGLGQSLAKAVSGRDDLGRAGVYASTWASFVVGVGCGTICIVNFGVITSLLITLASLIFLAAIANDMTVRAAHAT